MTWLGELKRLPRAVMAGRPTPEPPLAAGERRMIAAAPFLLLPLSSPDAEPWPLAALNSLAQGRTPRVLFVVEQDADLDTLCAAAAATPAFSCVCPVTMLNTVRDRLGAVVHLDDENAVVLPLSDEALRTHSEEDFRAARHSQAVTKLIERALDELVAALPEAAPLQRQVQALAVTFESTVYSQFSVALAYLEGQLNSEVFDAVIVLPSTSGTGLPLARMACGVQGRTAAWMLTTTEDVAEKTGLVRSWFGAEADGGSGDGRRRSRVVERHLAGLRRLMGRFTAEEQKYAGQMWSRFPGWPRCGLLVAHNTDAVGVGAGKVLKALTDIRPVAAIAFDLGEREQSSYWDFLLEAGPAMDKVQTVDVPLPSSALAAEGEFLFRYIAEAVQGDSVFRIGTQDFTAEILQILERRARHAFPLHLVGAARSRALVRVYCPDFVFAYPGAHIYARLLVSAARDFGVPTFDVQSVFISEYPRNVVHWTDTADTIMAMDERFARTLREDIGWPSERVLVTGTPRLDVLVENKLRLSRKDARNRFPELTGSPKVVSFFTQFSQKGGNVEILDALLRMTRSRRDVHVVAKLHPRLKDHEIAEIADCARAADGRCTVIRAGDSYDLIRASDVVVTKYSNIALEAAVLDRPVMLFNFAREHFDPPLDLQNWGIGEPVYDYAYGERLLKALLRGLGSSGRRARARQAAFFAESPQHRDGRALARIVSAVRDRMAS